MQVKEKQVKAKGFNLRYPVHSLWDSSVIGNCTEIYICYLRWQRLPCWQTQQLFFSHLLQGLDIIYHFLLDWVLPWSSLHTFGCSLSLSFMDSYLTCLLNIKSPSLKRFVLTSLLILLQIFSSNNKLTSKRFDYPIDW